MNLLSHFNTPYRTFYLWVLIFILFSSCQTNMLNEFLSISPGMEKEDVVEKVGSPTTTQRAEGKDKWFYIFYSEKVRYEKEIQFSNGAVTYAGDRVELSPEKQAGTVDQENLYQNSELINRYDPALTPTKPAPSEPGVNKGNSTETMGAPAGNK